MTTSRTLPPKLLCKHFFLNFFVSSQFVILTASRDSAGRSEVEQDSNYVARSTLNKSIGVPTCAVSVSRAFRSKGKPEEVPHHKKRKTKLIMSEASVISEGESLSDIEALISDDEDEVIPVRGKPKSTGNVVKSVTALLFEYSFH